MPLRSTIATLSETGSATEDPEAIRVLLVIRNDLVRRGLRRVLATDGGILVVGEARDLDPDLLATVDRRPHVLVTDVPLCDARPSGPASAVPTVGVVLVARRVHPGSLREGLRSGALGCVLEDAADVDLVASVRAAANGERYMSRAIERLLIEICLEANGSSNPRDPLAPLTDREREILRLIAEGHRPHAIARLLGIARSTVDTHRRSLMAKLDLHNLSQLVRFAVRVGLAS